MKKLLFILPLFFSLIGCTISITQTDTHGVSDDVVDTNASADADVQADASIPLMKK